MSNRAQRRCDLRAFRREAHKTHLVTYMIAADDDVSLDGHPLLRNALTYWRGNIARRRPFCPVCKRNYADDAHPGALLFATIGNAPSSVSVSAFCDRCWDDLPPATIEREAARVLRAVLPGGRFIDGPQR